MPIISIPSSIGGVSVPQGALNGPLARLFGKSNNLNIHQWPPDLASNPARAHSVEFKIMEIQPQRLSQAVSTLVESVGKAPFVLPEKGKDVWDPAINLVKAGWENAKIVGSLIKNSLGTVPNQSIQVTLAPEVVETGTYIVLYMPDTVAMHYNADWDQISLTSAIGPLGRIAQGAVDVLQAPGGPSNIVHNLLGAVKGPATLEAVGKVLNIAPGVHDMDSVLLNAGGFAINPQLQLLYKGIGLREFQLVFYFAPKSEKEAEDVRDIIDEFRRAFLPTVRSLSGGNQGMYLEMPSVFEIKFNFKKTDAVQEVINSVLGNLGPLGQAITPLLPDGLTGTKKENINVFKVGQCVITNITVDYAPSGVWATYSDGTPIQTSLTLQFKETKIMDRNTYSGWNDIQAAGGTR